MSSLHSHREDHHPADALLAAFVDGGLNGEQTRWVVAHLVTCEVCRQVVADTAAFVSEPGVAEFVDEAESGEEGGEPSTGSGAGTVLRPAESRFRRALPLVATLVAAAGLTALVVLTPVGRDVVGWGRGDIALAELTAGLDGNGMRPYFADPYDGTSPAYDDGLQGWDVLKGGEAPALDAEVSFQLGVQVSYLDGALLSENREAAWTLVARIQRKVEPLVISAAAYRQLQRHVEEGASFDILLAGHSQAEHRLTDEHAGYHRSWFQLGRWAGAARLAVASDDISWFAERTHSHELHRLERLDWPPAVAMPLETLSRLLDGERTATEWREVHGTVIELVAVGGNHDR